MTEAERLIDECEGRGVVLTLGESSTTLAFDAPRGALTPALRARLVEHKADVIQTLFEREERAALAGAPEWMDAGAFLRVINHPAVLKLQSLGLAQEIVSIRPTRRAESDAA